MSLRRKRKKIESKVEPKIVVLREILNLSLVKEPKILPKGQKILSIVTRHMPTKRKDSFKRMMATISPMQDKIQHIVIEDKVCSGWRQSAQLVVDRRKEIIGYYVWLLDDDDECTASHLPLILERVRNLYDVDIIIVKAWMQRHGIVPVPEYWDSHDIFKFVACTIGMPCFILKNELFQRHVLDMPTADRWVDWQLFSSVQNGIKKYNYKWMFLDLLVMRQATKLFGTDEKIDRNDPEFKILYGGE